MTARIPIGNLLTRLRPLHSHSLRLGGRTDRLIQLSQPFCRARLFGRMTTRMPIRHLTTSRFQELPADDVIEEELVPGYRPDDYYPVKLGEVFNTREPRYLTLKVCTVNRKSAVASQADTEIAVSQYINSVGAEHPGIHYMRLMIDEFTVEGPSGAHRCLLFRPLGMTLTDLRNLMPEKALEKGLLQQSLQLVLFALDLLHQAGAVHTDVSPNNVLMSVRDPGVWEKVEQAEKEHPVPRKTLPDRTIYLSQQIPPTNGTAILTDFGFARMGEEKFKGDVMPEVYRAPEVILDMEWDSKIDIWSVGVMIWDLYQGGRLFFARKNGMLDDEQHLAEMVSLMGPPPPGFLRRSEKCRQYWDDDGNWIAFTPIPVQSFEVREHRLEGEDHDLFVAFARKVLRWLPEERPAADELIGDSFLSQHIREREKANR